jgi:transcriptional regulator with XRE-family HTH domain
MKVSEAVGNRILALIKERNITRYRLATNAGLPPQTIDYIINHKSSEVKVGTIIQIAIGLDMTVSEFLNDPLFSEENLDI